MGETSYSMADINLINTTVNDALATMEAKIAVVEEKANNTGLQGTAGELMQKCFAEVKSKLDTAKQKIAAESTVSDDKVASETAKNVAIEGIAGR